MQQFESETHQFVKHIAFTSSFPEKQESSQVREVTSFATLTEVASPGSNQIVNPGEITDQKSNQLVNTGEITDQSNRPHTS